MIFSRIFLVTLGLSLAPSTLAGCCPTATGYCCTEPCACDFSLYSEAMGCNPCAQSSECYNSDMCSLVRGVSNQSSSLKSAGCNPCDSRTGCYNEDMCTGTAAASFEDPSNPHAAWLKEHGNLDACCGCDCHCANCGGACPPCLEEVA